MTEQERIAAIQEECRALAEQLHRLRYPKKVAAAPRPETAKPRTFRPVSLPLIRTGRRLPTRLAITLTNAARVHVLASREAHGLLLWHPRDLFVLVRQLPGVPTEAPEGKEPLSHACRPVGSG